MELSRAIVCVIILYFSNFAKHWVFFIVAMKGRKKHGLERGKN